MPHTVGGCPKRVLVIDDNVDLAESLSMVLEIAGHCTATAHDGDAGIERANSFAPDVVVCDLDLPSVHGLEVARALRASCSARLIAMSAHDLEREAIEAGFAHFVLKPPDLRYLAQLISE